MTPEARKQFDLMDQTAKDTYEDVAAILARLAVLREVIALAKQACEESE